MKVQSSIQFNAHKYFSRNQRKEKTESMIRTGIWKPEKSSLLWEFRIENVTKNINRNCLTWNTQTHTHTIYVFTHFKWLKFCYINSNRIGWWCEHCKCATPFKMADANNGKIVNYRAWKMNLWEYEKESEWAKEIWSFKLVVIFAFQRVENVRMPCMRFVKSVSRNRRNEMRSSMPHMK